MRAVLLWIVLVALLGVAVSQDLDHYDYEDLTPSSEPEFVEIDDAISSGVDETSRCRHNTVKRCCSRQRFCPLSQGVCCGSGAFCCRIGSRCLVSRDAFGRSMHSCARAVVVPVSSFGATCACATACSLPPCPSVRCPCSRPTAVIVSNSTASQPSNQTTAAPAAPAAPAAAANSSAATPASPAPLTPTKTESTPAKSEAKSAAASTANAAPATTAAVPPASDLKPWPEHQLLGPMSKEVNFSLPVIQEMEQFMTATKTQSVGTSNTGASASAGAGAALKSLPAVVSVDFTLPNLHLGDIDKAADKLLGSSDSSSSSSSAASTSASGSSSQLPSVPTASVSVTAVNATTSTDKGQVATVPTAVTHVTPVSTCSSFIKCYLSCCSARFDLATRRLIRLCTRKCYSCNGGVDSVMRPADQAKLTFYTEQVSSQLANRSQGCYQRAQLKPKCSRKVGKLVTRYAKRTEQFRRKLVSHRLRVITVHAKKNTNGSAFRSNRFMEQLIDAE